MCPCMNEQAISQYPPLRAHPMNLGGFSIEGTVMCACSGQSVGNSRQKKTQHSLQLYGYGLYKATLLEMFRMFIDKHNTASHITKKGDQSKRELTESIELAQTIANIKYLHCIIHHPNQCLDASEFLTFYVLSVPPCASAKHWLYGPGYITYGVHTYEAIS